MYKKTLLLLIFTLMVASSLSFSISETGFNDVNETDWFYDAVTQMANFGIINGYADGSFKPYEQVKRNEYAKMLVKTLKIPTSENVSSSFIDLNNTDWETPYVESAKAYLTGYQTLNGDLFKPDEATMREDIMVALVKALDYEVNDASISLIEDYEDFDLISKNLRPFVAKAIEEGIVNGYEEDGKKYIRPQQAINRAETANLLLKVIGEEKITYEDVEKVTYDESTDTIDDFKIWYEEKSDGVVIKWNQISSSNIKGYKVMASKTKEKPTYPEDGYYQFVTNNDESFIKVGSKYNNGDFVKFESNESYYFNVNLLLSDSTIIHSNTLELKMPDYDVDYTTTGVTINKMIFDDSVKIYWDAENESEINGYKVVLSKTKEIPIYPGDGYYKYITSGSSVKIYPNTTYNNGDISKIISGETYYININTLYKNGEKIPSNPLEITIP